MTKRSSFTATIVPKMPPDVTTSSPFCNAFTIASCCFCFLRCGAMSRKYMAAIKRNNGSMPMRPWEAEGAVWVWASSRANGVIFVVVSC